MFVAIKTLVTLQVQALAKLVQVHTPQTGVYEITDPCKSDQQITQFIQARCDVGRDGGGWTVILRRKQNGPRTSFNRDWDDYENGFGDPNNEFWIGLRNIHCLTRRDDVDLIIDLRDNNGNGMAWFYDHFEVAGSNENYRLTIGKGVGPPNGYDAMAHLNHSQFTTRNSDNDLSSSNCARNTGGGGWWHTNCGYVQLTGTYSTYTFWYKGSGSVSQTTSSSYYYHYQNVEMKIRPKTCKNEC